jgi:hypothetical protein
MVTHEENNEEFPCKNGLHIVTNEENNEEFLLIAKYNRDGQDILEKSLLYCMDCTIHT